MARRIQVEGHVHLARDPYSGGIVNTSRSEYITYMEVQKKKLEERERMHTMCDELNSLKDEMHEIKYMLKKILEK